MDKEKRTSALRAAMHVAPPHSHARKRATRKASKRRVQEPSEEEAKPEKPLSTEHASTDAMGSRPKFLQPTLVTGGKLKDYQLDGVEWMVSLDKNGVSGILGTYRSFYASDAWLTCASVADEMGLGKVSRVWSLY